MLCYDMISLSFRSFRVAPESSENLDQVLVESACFLAEDLYF